MIEKLWQLMPALGYTSSGTDSTGPYLEKSLNESRPLGVKEIIILLRRNRQTP